MAGQAARGPVPSTHEESIQISAPAITEIAGHPELGQTRAISVDLAITNSSSDDWTFDISDQAMVADGTISPAIHATSDIENQSKFRIAPREKRVITLYFPIPQNAEPDSELPRRFELLWKIRTPDKTLASGVVYERKSVPTVARRPEGYGYPVFPDPYSPYETDPMRRTHDFAEWRYG